MAEGVTMDAIEGSGTSVIGRIRLGGFVEHFKIVEHISYSTGTSRNFVEHKRCQ